MNSPLRFYVSNQNIAISTTTRMSSTYRYKLPLIKSGMYVKTPVITVLHNYFYSHWQEPDNHGDT
jgi:hypothetical protein